MDQLEILREKLHKTLESGNINDILTLSRELDTLILSNMKTQQRLYRIKHGTGQEKYRKSNFVPSRTVPEFTNATSQSSAMNALK